MAKATYQCAKCAKLVEAVARNRSEADRLATYRDGQGALCSGCWAAEREVERAAESVAAEAKAAAAGLPALTGTDKQVAWANTLREKILAELDKAAALASTKLADPESPPALQDQARQVLVGAELIRAKTAASWWIDNRHGTVRTMMLHMRAEIEVEMARRAVLPTTPAETAEEQAAQEEALLKPAASVSQQVADIAMSGEQQIRISFPECLDAVREAMHAMGYKWVAPHWVKALSYRTGDTADRLAEAATRLLTAGVMVRMHHAAARDKAIAGDYAPEQQRWISQQTVGAYAGWYVVKWPKSDDLYAPAKKLLGARYADGTIYVPPGSTDEVLDFAEHYGFTLSPGARSVADARHAEMARGVVVAAPRITAAPAVRESDRAAPDPLETPDHAEVDDELRDPD